MRHHSLPLNAPVTVSIGTAQLVRDLQEKWVQVGGTFVATMNLQVSLDNGVNWFSIATGLNAAGLTQVLHPATHVRVQTTAFTSGTPQVTLAGFDANG